MAMAAYLLLLALVTVATTVATSTPEAMRQVILSTPQGRVLPKADVAQIAAADARAAVGVACLLAIVYLIVGLGAYRGWRWAFWAALVFSALEAAAALKGVPGILQPGNSRTPEAVLLVNWLIAVAGLGMFGWLVWGLVRGRHQQESFPPPPASC